MNKKRDTLKKVVGIGVVSALVPRSWTKPIVSSVFLPAHAQTSANEAPTVSGISCAFDTPTLQVGSVITIRAIIEDVDTSIADIEWGLRSSNSGLIVTGEGQFTASTYTVVESDVGNLVIELEVFDGTGNDTVVTLCDEEVAGTPDVLFYVDDGFTLVGKTIENPLFCRTDTDFTAIIDIRDAEGPGSDGILPQFRGLISVFSRSDNGAWGIDFQVDSFGDIPGDISRIRRNCSEGDVVEPVIIEAGWLQVSYTLISSVLILKLLN